MGHFMRCDYLGPVGKRCGVETPEKRSVLKGSDWFVDGDLTICPKHAGPYARDRLRKLARQSRINLAVEDFRRKLEQQPDTADGTFDSAAVALAEAFRKSGAGKKIIQRLNQLSLSSPPKKPK